MKARIKRVKCRSGLTGWQCRLRNNYKSYEEWEANADLWGLHIKLGYKTPQNAWRFNPIVQGSVIQRIIARSSVDGECSNRLADVLNSETEK